MGKELKPPPTSWLTAPLIGGIIGGVVFIVVVLLNAAFLILRRLNNKAIRITTLANSRTVPCSRHSRRPWRNQDIDALSVDPLMMAPSEASSSIKRPSHMLDANIPIQATETNSPPLFNSPFSPYTPPYIHYPKGYNPVSSCDSGYQSQSSRGYQHPLAPLQYNANARYFDISSQSAERTSQHARPWSNASDQSQVSKGSSAELDTMRDADIRSTFTRALQGLRVGMSRMIRRRRDHPVTLTGDPIRVDFYGQGLGHIPEAEESRIDLEAGGGNMDSKMREISNR
jgi:hypothetical protein